MRAALGLLMALLLSACVDTATTPQTAHPASLPACHVSYVVDGDTVHMICGGREMKVRLLGFDTPEVFSPKCQAEKQAGDMATRALKQIVRSGPVTGADFQGHDSYGRELVRLQIGGRDVAQQMISTGLALPYAGQRHPNWCSILS